MKNVINRTLASAVIGIAAGFALNASAENYEVTQVTSTQASKTVCVYNAG